MMDRQLAGQSSSTSIYQYNRQLVTKKLYLSCQQDELEDKIDKETVIMNQVSYEEMNMMNRQFKTQIISKQ